jgi:hypothetical protein
MKEKQEHILPVRFPQHVWDQLAQLAEDEERSINWEVIQAVRERIARQKKGQKSHAHEDI